MSLATKIRLDGTVAYSFLKRLHMDLTKFGRGFDVTRYHGICWQKNKTGWLWPLLSFCSDEQSWNYWR